MVPIRSSVAAVAVAAFWAIAVLGATMLPMIDPDTWWHIRVGREILATGAVPSADTWSIAGNGRPWVSQDWASNVVMALLYLDERWGPTLVSLAYGLIAVAAVAVLWDAIGVRERSVSWVARAGWLLAGLVLAAPVLGARVQAVDLLLAAAVLNVMWRYLDQPRSWLLVAVPVISVAWVNLHAGFPLLFLIGGAVVVGELVDARLARPVTDPPLSGRSVAGLAGSLAVAAFALVLNPNGTAMYSYPFETLGLSALGSFVGEWQPARFDAPAGLLLALFIVAGVLPALLFGKRTLRTADGLVLLGLAFMATTAVRFLLVAGPIGTTICCVALAPVMSSTRFGAAWGRIADRIGQTPSGIRGLLNGALLIGVVVVGVVSIAVRIGPRGQSVAIGEAYPVGAVTWLVTERPGERIFNRYEWGGYLGLRRPDELIFIDGRADVYGDAVIREYVETISVNDDPQAYFDRHRIDHVLYAPDTSLGAWLNDSAEWRVVYEGDVGSVWVRD